ncbi:integral membrane protein 2B [Bacillus rossius redtenbacheri]|uniref:integral membrane protein 2B n=1 Tax=Bacillus rossius redtenbacheri TaxID=93214 RepID=UPI002FDD24C8
MTIVTKPISEKKADNLEEPLVDNEELEPIPAKVDIEATAEPDHHYLVLRSRARRISTATTICLFLTALLVMSIGIIGGMYLYRQFAQVEMHRFRGWCSIPYDGTKASMYHSLQQDSGLADSKMFKSIAKSDNGLTDDSEPQFFDEKFELDLENENFEKIDVPDFRDGRRGRFIHDFNANKTGIIDLDESRCFVMPLDRNRVLAPRSLFDLIKKMWEGYYEVNTEVVRETMRVVTPAITDFKTVGYYIARECEEKPTYMLEKYVSGVFKRSVPGKSTEYAGFAGNNIYQLHILGIPDDDAAEVKKIEEA